MKWAGHEYDAAVKTSRVDRGYTDYSEEYLLQEINKIDYKLWYANKFNKTPDLRQKWHIFTSQSLPKDNKTGENLLISSRFDGACDRTWTDTVSLPRDFKSLVSADSTTQAYFC